MCRLARRPGRRHGTPPALDPRALPPRMQYGFPRSTRTQPRIRSTPSTRRSRTRPEHTQCRTMSRSQGPPYPLYKASTPWPRTRRCFQARMHRTMCRLARRPGRIHGTSPALDPRALPLRTEYGFLRSMQTPPRIRGTLSRRCLRTRLEHTRRRTRSRRSGRLSPQRTASTPRLRTWRCYLARTWYNPLRRPAPRRESILPPCLEGTASMLKRRRVPSSR